MNVLSKFQSYMTGRKGLLPASLVLSALSTLAGMVPYIIIWFIIRELFSAGTSASSSFVLGYAWWAVGSALVSVVLYFSALTLSHLAAFRVEVNMRRYAMQNIVRMPLGFFDKNTTGRIRKIIDDNAGITHGFLAHQLPDLAGALLSPLAIVVMLFVFDWRLAIACMVPVVVSMLIMSSMMGKKGRYFMESYMTSLEEMNTEAVEYVRGIPVVKVFQQTVYSFKSFYNSIVKYKKMVTEYTRMWEKPMSLYTAIINGFVFFLVPTALLIITRTGNYASTILNLFLYVLVTPVFSQSIMRSMYLNQASGQAIEAVNRIENLTNYPRLSEAACSQRLKAYDIEFRNVSFSYPGTGKKIIGNVSFTVPEGNTVALVGASGGGKTTVARLVPRFWDTDDGQVLIDGVDVRAIGSKELMEKVSFVFQNTRLFKTSLLENILYGNPAASLAEVEEAVDLAQCRDIITKLPDGLHTRIGVEGTYLSGGEQQRIVLARAFLKDAPIVVLDEATAFTDPENEHLIQKALRNLSEKKTVLMIAHRLTSVVEADSILVIQDGRIAEQGTHDKLLRKEGLYTGMWNEYQRSVNWTIGEGIYA